MAKTITTRLPEKYVLGLKTVAEREGLDTSAAIRKLLSRALDEWRQDYAVEQYKLGKFSFGQAARFSEVSVWEFPGILRDKKVPIPYDSEELEADLRAIQWKR